MDASLVAPPDMLTATPSHPGTEFPIRPNDTNIEPPSGEWSLNRRAADDVFLTNANDGVDAARKRKRVRLDLASRQPTKAHLDRKAYTAKRKNEILRSPGSITGRRPKDLVAALQGKSKLSASYSGGVEKLSNAPLSDEQLEDLVTAAVPARNYFGRTASLEPGHRFLKRTSASNGHTDAMIMMPAAETSKEHGVHASLQNFAQGGVVYMLGHHLMWTDIRGDEFLSYSNDPLFLVAHALGRFHKGQGNVTIQFLDRRHAKTVTGQRASFYPALDLYEIFEIKSWTGWSSPQQFKLRSRKFTQELLSHGTVLVSDDRFQQAPIEKLIKDGLYDIFPAFEVPGNHERSGLYSSQVAFRKAGYPPSAGVRTKNGHEVIYSYHSCSDVVPFTTESLDKVRHLTMNFMATPTATGAITDSASLEMGPVALLEPHLHVFLSFLTFQKRPEGDKRFLEWIREHYKAEDVVDLYSDENGRVLAGFTRVAGNLPGVMQYIDLVRDACSVFGLQDLPETVIEAVNPFTLEDYVEADSCLQRNVVPSWEYDEDRRLKLREAASKKKQVRAAKAEETSEKGFVEAGNESEVEGELRGDVESGDDEDEEEVVVSDQ